MNAEEKDLMARLLSERIGWLRRQIREEDNLATPVEPGHWRWADVKPGGYGRKSEEELAKDRARAATRAGVHRTELAVATSAWRSLQQEVTS